MLKIVGILAGLVIQASSMASIYPLSGVAVDCDTAPPCKVFVLNDCQLITKRQTVLLSDLLNLQNIKISPSNGLSGSGYKQGVFQSTSYIKPELLNSKTFGMLFPVR